VSIAFVHGRIAMAMVLFTIASAVYGLVEYFRKKPVSPNYWGMIVVGNLLALGQGGIGAWMALDGATPARGWIHILYGVVAVLWVPLIQFADNQLLKEGHAKQQETLVCAIVSLFEFGIALRAMTTGG
jgi:heme A synthase